MSVPSPSVTASATIEPMRMCTVSGAFTVAQTGANGIPVGISKEMASVNELVTSHALAGDPVSLEMARGGTYPIIAGGTIAAGVRFKSDSTGRAVTSLTAGVVNQESGGITLEGGAVNERILVVWDPQVLRPALT